VRLVRMSGHPAVVERLLEIHGDQRGARTGPARPAVCGGRAGGGGKTTPPRGPVLCVAPAGSGKTTTLVARIAWLIDEGAAPETICAITFNKRAAEELRERVGVAVAPLGDGLADRIRIRTFHALGL